MSAHRQRKTGDSGASAPESLSLYQPVCSSSLSRSFSAALSASGSGLGMQPLGTHSLRATAQRHLRLTAFDRLYSALDGGNDHSRYNEQDQD